MRVGPPPLVVRRCRTFRRREANRRRSSDERADRELRGRRVCLRGSRRSTPTRTTVRPWSWPTALEGVTNFERRRSDSGVARPFVSAPHESRRAPSTRSRSANACPYGRIANLPGGLLDRSVLVPALKNVATQLRIDSIRSTSESGTGHPSSCMSAADLVAALFFAEMRFDPKDPQHPGSDRFVLSKGHAAPLLYAAWAEAGAFDRSELLNVRALTLGSRRASNAAPAVCGRRHRIARPGHLRRGRLRAERAPHQVRLPHLLPDWRRRVGRRVGLGSRGSRGQRRPRQPRRHHRRQRPRPKPRDDVGARPGAVRAPMACVRLARGGRRRPRHVRHPRRVRRSARPRRAARR